jgi:transposase InsO family protein
VPNSSVLADIIYYQSDKDTDYGYHKMTYQLHQIGYYINHKKVYRIMKTENLLKEKHKKASKNYAKYRVICPEEPLSLIEMDIKQVWITENRSHAYILTIIDTFTRFALYKTVGFSMKSYQIKKAWEYVIEKYLQPADMLNKKINIEVRNDNGPQFIAKTVRDFFAKNHLNQVFTHPYTPQENGHIESFHAILSNSLGKNPFWSIQELEQKLNDFYPKYNSVRLHGSIANLTPYKFWVLWENNLIERKVLKHKKVKFKLKIPYQELSGNMNLKEVPCLIYDGLDVHLKSFKNNEVIELESLQKQLSVQKSPSVVPC